VNEHLECLPLDNLVASATGAEGTLRARPNRIGR
jgi:hypothetical protein